jgi:hypothetical protein
VGRRSLVYDVPVPEASDPQSLEMRARLAEERTLDAWTQAVAVSAVGSMTVGELQNSLSWRITRPIRLAEIVLDRYRRVGARRTLVAIRERLALQRAARRRG